ncbi:hypothetical protein ACE01N_07565 [Saccharicrinis sp. FJH2]|uniref:hypothetical protein n=1 Tax=Saccharicrinis sp. FJH65 TaxID=3344659 RepID=UPI0035F2B05E
MHKSNFEQILEDILAVAIGNCHNSTKPTAHFSQKTDLQYLNHRKQDVNILKSY